MKRHQIYDRDGQNISPVKGAFRSIFVKITVTKFLISGKYVGLPHPTLCRNLYTVRTLVKKLNNTDHVF